jgi:RES domain-containing protein
LTISAWRIVKRRYAKAAFSGEGARRYGGRWKSPGVSLVYTAGSQALAALEILVHLDSAELLQQYVVIEVHLDQSLVARLDPARLPGNWRAGVSSAALRRIGDRWAKEGTSAVLEVPSAIIPAEHNFLLNPRHPDFAKLGIGEPVRFEFDRRLGGGR